MAWTKVRAGVLRVETPAGPLYLKLSLIQRLTSLYVFRNFRRISLSILRGWERELVEKLCNRNEFVSWKGLDRYSVIGTVEGVPYAVLVRATDAGIRMAGVPLAAHRRF